MAVTANYVQGKRETGDRTDRKEEEEEEEQVRRNEWSIDARILLKEEGKVFENTKERWHRGGGKEGLGERKRRRN